MKAINLKRYNGEGKTRGFFDVETQEGIMIKGFKIVEGANGLFVGNPSRYSKKDEKWYDDVYGYAEPPNPILCNRKSEKKSWIKKILGL